MPRFSPLKAALRGAAFAISVSGYSAYGNIITMGDVTPDINSATNRTVIVNVSVGNTANGVADVTNGSKLTIANNRNLFIGVPKNIAGSVTVSDPGSLINIESSLFVGGPGVGNLTIQNKGKVTAAAAHIGGAANNPSTVQVGSGATLEVRGPTPNIAPGLNLTVGDGGPGKLLVKEGGTVTVLNGGITAGVGAGDVGDISVVGNGSTVTTKGSVAIGSKGNGTLGLDAGGTFTSGGFITIGANAGSKGKVIVGAGSTLTSKDPIIDAADGSASLEVADKGTVDGEVFVNVNGVLTGKKGVKNFEKNVHDSGGKISAAPGAFDITGAYAQSAGSSLEIDIGGTGAGDFAVLNVSDAATVDPGAVMQFGFINGFAPKAGDMFEFLTASAVSLSPNDFNCADGILVCSVEGLHSGFLFDVESTPTALILVALNNGYPVPEPASAAILAGGLGLLVALRRRTSRG